MFHSSKTKCFKVIIITQQHCLNIISILLWQHVSVLLDHLHASIQRYELQSVHIVYSGIPYYLQGVHKKIVENYINYKIKYIESG
jgi:hypothetical protein